MSINIKVNEQVEILTAAMSIACSATTRATGRESKPTGGTTNLSLKRTGRSPQNTTKEEGMRHKLLTLALKRHPDREARPVTVFPNISEDKCAGSWLLATPSPDLSLSAKIFREAFSAHLSLPSPELRDGGWVGRPVGTPKHS